MEITEKERENLLQLEKESLREIVVKEKQNGSSGKSEERLE